MAWPGRGEGLIWMGFNGVSCAMSSSKHCSPRATLEMPASPLEPSGTEQSQVQGNALAVSSENKHKYQAPLCLSHSL